MTSFFKNFIFWFVLFLVMLHQSLFAQQRGQYISRSVTVAEYCRFLNCVAATDCYHLYDPKMEHAPAMIKRHGRPGKYDYECSQFIGDITISYVNRLSQARFCNWKENGEKPHSTETGVYDLTSLTNGADALGFLFLPEPNAHYRLDAKFNNVDPMLGLGSGDGFVMECKADRSISPDDKNDSCLGADVLCLEKGLENNTPNVPLLGSPLIESSTKEGSSTASKTAGTTISPIAITANLCPIKIKLIVIDDPGNEPSSVEQGGWGAVSNIFQIGETDITAEQYCTFLKAVATNNDYYELYDTNMGSDSNIACITRSGESGSYDYQVIPGREKFPITYISAGRAAAFCNWMENIENNKPIEGEESLLKGAFDITYTTNYFYKNIITPPTKNFNGTTTPGSISTTITGTNIYTSVLANTNARWSLPTEDQWCKAAYYKKALVGMDGFTKHPPLYYLYGTGDNTSPNNSIEVAQSSHNAANFCLVDSDNGLHYTEAEAPHITPVGFFKKTKSPFGLYDMSGNVDQLVLFENKDEAGTRYWAFSVRGGSWKSTHSSFERMPADGSIKADTGEIGVTSLRRPINLATTTNTIGFRLVYNAPPSPESYAHEFRYGALRIGARFWSALKQTGEDINPFSSKYRHKVNSAGMDFYNWSFGMIVPEFWHSVLVELYNMEFSPIAIGNVTEETSFQYLGRVLNHVAITTVQYTYDIVKAFGRAVNGTLFKGIGLAAKIATNLLPNAAEGAVAVATTTAAETTAATAGVVSASAVATLPGAVATLPGAVATLPGAMATLPGALATLATVAEVAGLSTPLGVAFFSATMVSGVVCSYYGDDITDAMGGFGQILNGGLHLWYRKW
ncbi:MAG: formylglycine-generating enzyme family protein [Chthoniobacterales bacterium]|nr:formylglycine-generating enzyme family protein [Chthoniobacterales bacterium]